MKIFSHQQTFEHNWEAVSLAFFQKYPNPYANHVLSTDTISRWVDDAGRLHSCRLLLKTGGSAVPSWLQLLIKSREALVLEESIVDPSARTMSTSTHNLSHRTFMSIEELQTFRVSTEDLNSTTIDTQAKFHCALGRWTGIPGRLEGLGVTKFKDHLQRSRQSLAYVAERIKMARAKTGSSDPHGGRILS